ncbi:hypothetical protein PanWU01x14_085010 [Parasponia andersonii]|uniref:Uncharacterized protein n=1 Tax=Parasponia andersonii TaxID=3476 RepID=A0A2P5D8T3_PARAD|nr:hypothetical protein PanWU01x14_085010 [Parasponia andersonii]
MQYMAKNDAILQNQATTLRSFETQLGQLANAINNSPQGTLPGNTKVNPKRENKEQCKVIILRSGKEVRREVEEPVGTEGENIEEKPHEESLPEATSKPEITPYDPPPPFPQRFQKKKLDQKFSSFLDLVQSLNPSSH